MNKHSAILAAIETALSKVLPANGFHTAAGLYVWRNLEYQVAPPDLPCCIFFPGDVTDTLGGETPPSQGEENHYLPFRIVGLIADGERGEKAEELRQDILRSLKADMYFGGLTEGFEGGINSSATSELGMLVGADGTTTEGFLGEAEVAGTIFYVTLWGEQ